MLLPNSVKETFISLALLPSMWAVCDTLLSGFIQLSASPLASGSSGLTTMVLTPAHFMYIWYSWLPVLLNGGPPSVLTVSGNQ